MWRVMVGLVGLGVDLVKPVEHSAELFEGDASAFVAHADLDLVTAAYGSEMDRTPRRTELDGVAHQVDQGLDHPVAVAEHVGVRLLEHQVDAGVLSQRSHRLHRVEQQRVQVALSRV